MSYLSSTVVRLSQTWRTVLKGKSVTPLLLVPLALMKKDRQDLRTTQGERTQLLFGYARSRRHRER